MLTSKRFSAVAIALTVAAGTALAQTTTQNMRLTGNLPGASAALNGANYYAQFSISPVLYPGSAQEVFLLYWSTTVYGAPLAGGDALPTIPPPPPPDSVFTGAAAIVPVTMVRRLVSGDISLDIDLDKVQLQYLASTRCINGECSPIQPPVSFPLTGAITRVVNGPGTSSSSMAGNRSSLLVDGTCRIENFFGGQVTDTAARFAGRIGSVSISALSVGSNAQLHVQKGQLAQTLTCTPPAGM